jgi:hypothetical protein
MRMPIRSSVRYPYRAWTRALFLRFLNRSGQKSRKRLVGSGSALRTCWTLPRCAAIARGRTPRAGAATSTSCCRRDLESAKSGTWPPCLTTICPFLSRTCAGATPLQPAGWSSGEVIGARDKVEQAYRRGDMFEKRRRLMQQWATFCAAAPTRQDGNITALRSRMSA